MPRLCTPGVILATCFGLFFSGAPAYGDLHPFRRFQWLSLSQLGFCFSNLQPSAVVAAVGRGRRKPCIRRLSDHWSFPPPNSCAAHPLTSWAANVRSPSGLRSPVSSLSWVWTPVFRLFLKTVSPSLRCCSPHEQTSDSLLFR